MDYNMLKMNRLTRSMKLTEKELGIGIGCTGRRYPNELDIN